MPEAKPPLDTRGQFVIYTYNFRCNKIMFNLTKAANSFYSKEVRDLSWYSFEL